MDQMPVIEFARSTRSVYPPLLPIPAHEQFVRIDVKLPWPLATKYREGLVASNGDQLWLQEFLLRSFRRQRRAPLFCRHRLCRRESYHLRSKEFSMTTISKSR